MNHSSLQISREDDSSRSLIFPIFRTKTTFVFAVSIRFDSQRQAKVTIAESRVWLAWPVAIGAIACNVYYISTWIHRRLLDLRERWFWCPLFGRAPTSGFGVFFSPSEFVTFKGCRTLRGNSAGKCKPAVESFHLWPNFLIWFSIYVRNNTIRRVWNCS